MKVAGLFAGVGGIELGLGESGHDAELLCEVMPPALTVLAARFPDVELATDVTQLKSLPRSVEIVTAGFPCQDLSQAGKTAGIDGGQSGLVTHVFRLLRRRHPTWLVIENVQNMLALDQGRAMAYLVAELESMKYRWAYRVVDSRFTGVAQRRRRVILVASRTEDPCGVLFADDAGEPDSDRYRDDAFGFYWTEGRGGLGWAQDAVPTLKGGSTIGIPSPPAIWVRDAEPGRRIVTPSIEDAEALQGFPRGWTEPADTGSKNGPRWKLVGNAVTAHVAGWIGARLGGPGDTLEPGSPLDRQGSWPTAAYGYAGRAWRVPISEYPTLAGYRHLLDVVDVDAATPLTFRGSRGFLGRLNEGNLGRYPGFREDVADHVEFMDPDNDLVAV